MEGAPSTEDYCRSEYLFTSMPNITTANIHISFEKKLCSIIYSASLNLTIT